ncbi:MAG: putative metal-binding motif-containing protein [Myxococcota bacterium]
MRMLLLSGALFTLIGCDVSEPLSGVDMTDADEDGFDTRVDCDDDDPAIHPGAIEICDEVDNNCDGDIDGGTGLTVFIDDDEDGYGDRASPAVSCEIPFGHAAERGDCDDHNPAVFPGADERCNNVDDDCDGGVDEDPVDSAAWYEDPDGDGFGDPATEQRGCHLPRGVATFGGDCDESDPEINPGAFERCNGLDDDCDPLTTEDSVVTFESYLSDEAIDLTPIFQSGSSLFPARYVNTEPGEMRLCGGKWYAGIETVADLDIRGVGGASFNELDANGRFPTLVIRDAVGGDVQVSVNGITLRRGDAQNGGQDGYRRSGGNLFCQGAARLTLNDVVVIEGRAESGGGMYIEDCPTRIADSTIRRNRAVYGAGINLYGDEDVVIERTTIAENDATTTGGGMYLSTRAGKVRVEMIDTVFDTNTANFQGSGAYLYRHWSGVDFDVSCIDTDPFDAIDSGFFRHSSTYLWASFGAVTAYVPFGQSRFASEGCSFLDNEPADLSWPGGMVDLGEDVMLECLGASCR